MGFMDMKVEIKKIDNADGIVFPRSLMLRLGLKRGQHLYVTELPGGGFQVTPYDPDFEATVRAADEVMEQYRDTLTVLAK
jgi:antitoxin component of MazEF toxin-antitoxin module